MTGHALLVVPLPVLADAVPRLSEGPWPAPAVTLLDPFLVAPDRGALDELAGLFADVVPFEVIVEELAEFPRGPTYLHPRPAAPFRHLAHSVARRFPEVGHHPTSFTDLPHLPVPPRPNERLEEMEAAMFPWLPARAFAEGAALWGRTDGPGETVISVLATFPFGTRAA
jgi:hypothetical protein